MRFVRSVLVLLLLAAWPAVTSHALLEQLGVIHQVHHHHDHSNGHSHDHEHEHNSDNHDFAHGDYLAKRGNDDALLRLDLRIYETSSLIVRFSCLADRSDVSVLGPAPPGVAPPEYLRAWNFLHRTAVDARAPSFIS